MPFPTVFKVKVVLNHCANSKDQFGNQYHIEVYTRNKGNLQPI